MNGGALPPEEYELPPDGAAPVEYEEVVEPEPPGRDLWPWLLLLAAVVLGGLSFLYFLSRDDEDEGGGVTTVVQTVEGGAGMVSVPNVVGRRQAEAAAALTNAGLRSEARERASNRRRGIVIDQQPNAGRRVERESTVTLVISRGPAEGTVPDLVGDGVDDARRELEAAGLEARVRRVFSDEVVNLVVGQRPAGGARIERGSAVTLQVSKGPRPVAVPNLVGSTRDDAEAALERLDLEANVFTVPAPDPEGTVVAQNPQPGQRVRPGSRVRINVSEGVTDTGAGTTTTAPPGTGTDTTTGAQQAPTVRVPDMVGLRLAAATRLLRQRGLRPSTRRVPSDQPAGIVVAQARRPGTVVRRGTAVGINVSRGPTQTTTTGTGAQASVPSVVGQDQAAAEDALRAAGFQPRVVEQPTPNADEEGIVIEQQPAPGTRAARGSTVTIFVGVLEGS